MKLIMLCGAGGAGKSTATNLLATRSDTVVMRSSSRDTYHRLKIPTETAAFGMDLDTQKNLQDEIMKDHLFKLENTFKEASQAGADFLVVDRSPFDHLTYWVRTNALDPKSSNSAFMENLMRVVATIDRMSPETVGFFDFTYPTPWPTADGMRDQNQIKTFEMSLMTSGMIHRFSRMLRARTFVHQMNMDEPSERAERIIYQMRRFSGVPA